MTAAVLEPIAYVTALYLGLLLGVMMMLSLTARDLRELDELRRLLGPNHHVLEVSEDGWAIRHPPLCRERNLLDCPVHGAAVDYLYEPPAEPGRYRIDLTADGHLHLGDREPDPDGELQAA